jgi:SAM-dependent methyltransferase
MVHESGMLTRFLELEASRTKPLSTKGLVWTAFGAFGNLFYQRPPPRATGARRLLNLGCGQHVVDGFVNADFFRFHQLIVGTDAPEWMLDLRKPLNCPDDYWDGIFMEHTNEHLSYSENHALLCELLRVLKPGSLLRLVVPDLDRYLRFEEHQLEFPKFHRYATLPEAVSSLTQGHGHRSVWNPALMAAVLADTGFVHAEAVDFQVGSDRELLVDTEFRRWESFYMEGRKPVTGTL